MKARQLCTMTDDFEVPTVDEFPVLGAANNPDKIVIGKSLGRTLPQERNVDAEDIWDVLDGMELLTSLL